MKSGGCGTILPQPLLCIDIGSDICYDKQNWFLFLSA